MRTSVRRMGNSSGVIIPKPILRELGMSTGDEVEMSLDSGRIILVPAKRAPREGWAEDAKALAESGEEPAWPEFANADDESFVW